MLHDTSERVPRHTDEEINQRIRQQTERNVLQCVAEGPAAINRRLADLDEEWDIERYLETMAPTFTLLGLGLAVTRNRAWLLVPIVVQSFFLQHALQGWCPPVPLLRRLGIRTMREIDQERYALKALRGDFEQVSPVDDLAKDGRITEALQAARS